MKRVTLLAVLAISLGLAAQAQASTLAKAQYLSATCANCHGTNGKSNGGQASLAGYDKAKFLATMKDFQAGKRPATIMHQLSKGYTDAQLEVMATFFANQK